MTLSEKVVKDILGKGDRDEIRSDLGFITTVLRDNEKNEPMRLYYELVLECIIGQMDGRGK